jgi:ATP-binding protein involved in chromosome partitioning
MPPGTGDIHLSMVQSVPLSFNGGGALIITTPSPLSLLDARKCTDMFRKTHVPILGVIENMSWLEDAATGARISVFGDGAGETLAREADARLLAQLPIEGELSREDGNALIRYVSRHAEEWEGVIASLKKI